MTKNKNIKQKNIESKKSKKSGWTLFWLSLVIFLVAVYFGWQYFQKPVSGEIVISKAVDSQEAEKTAYERFEGKYFSFHHDQRYVVKSHDQGSAENGITLETAFLSQGDVTPKKIAVTVESLKGRKMEDAGNFIMREKQKNLYTEQKNATEFSGSVSFVTKKDGFLEKVFFIPQKAYLVEIAFMGPIDENGEFEAEISDILNSLQFKDV